VSTGGAPKKRIPLYAPFPPSGSREHVTDLPAHILHYAENGKVYRARERKDSSAPATRSSDVFFKRCTLVLVGIPSQHIEFQVIEHSTSKNVSTDSSGHRQGPHKTNRCSYWPE
jgi:hypothetical protein